MSTDVMLARLLETTLQGTVLLSLIWLVLRWLNRGPASLRRLLLLLGLLAFPLLVLFSAVAPASWRLDLPLASQATSGGDRHALSSWQGEDARFLFTFAAAGKMPGPGELRDPPADPAALGWTTWATWALLLWGAGTLLLLARLALRVSAVSRLLRRPQESATAHVLALVDETCREAGLASARIAVCEHARAAAPMAWSLFSRTIVLPRSARLLPDQTLRLVLLHEMGHLKSRDTFVLLIADLIACALWFHPLVWISLRRLKFEQELAADDFVLHARVTPKECSRTLVDVVRLLRGESRREMPLLSPVGGSHIEARVRSLLDGRTKHGAIGWPTRILAALVLVGCSTILLALPAIARPRKPPPLVAIEGDSLTREKLEPFLDPLFGREMKQHRVPGAVVLVLHEGKTVFTKGYGLADVARAKPVVPERTIFRIGSVSKVVTAVALLQMVDEGKARFEDDVNLHLKKFHVDDAFPEPVRLENLLTHTAGFDQLGYGRHVLSREQQTPLGDFLQNNLVRIRPPGEITCYDTYAVTLAGYVVEILSGEPYHAYIAQHIFEPLAMQRTGIDVPAPLKDDVAVGYSGSDQPVAERWEFMNTDPASTINSTATDMARFMQMLLGDGEVDGHTILSPGSAAGIKKRQFGNHPSLPGFTWLLWEDTTYGINALSHGGSMTGFACFMYLLPANELGIFVAINREDGSMVHAILSPLLEMLTRTGAVDPSLEERFTREPERQSSVRVDVQRFLGTYADNCYNHSRPRTDGWSKEPFLVIADVSGRLLFGGLPCEPIQPLLFERKDGLLVAFRENAKGEITHMLVRQSVYEKQPKVQ